MCTSLWTTLTNRVWFEDHWNYYVTGPWNWCSRNPCTVWCLCCDRWLCWIGVILIAIIVITVFVLIEIFVFIFAIICEILCIIANIGNAPGKPSCFAFRGNTAPTPVTDGPYKGLVGQMIAMSAAGSTDAELDTISASWSLGDGSTQTGLAISHAYANVGVFTVEVTVSDNRGASATAQTTATISAIGSGGPDPPIDE